MRKCDLDRDWWQSSCLALRGHVRRGNAGRGGCQNRASRRAPAKGRAVRRCRRSPAVALASLAFLVIIHKLEYFVNARIIGTRIKAWAWELLGDLLRLYQRRANDAEVDLRSDLGPDRKGRGIAFDRTTDEHQTRAQAVLPGPRVAGVAWQLIVKMRSFRLGSKVNASMGKLRFSI